MFTLINLPYAPTALEPVISAQTLGFHHGKHLQTYVNNLNAALPGSPYEGLTLEEIVRKAEGGVFNNAGQILNHNLYFTQFHAPQADAAPKGALAAQIDSQFGSLEAFQAHPRIRVVSIDEGFRGNASLFKYARDLGNRRGDMYEIGLWEDSIVESGNDIMYAINIPQESVTIPETIDGIRAAMQMQPTREAGTAETNKYLGIGKFKK